MTPPFPPRLHALLSSDAPVGVVFRRGPSKQVCVVGWDRRDDRFTLGQWLKGRIYERRSDLSPDGRYLLYFAYDFKQSMEDGALSWTAVSRAPYLKAVAFHPKGDAWHGGGLFTGKSTYWLNDGHGHGEPRTNGEVRRDLCYQPPGPFGGECPGVYYPRLLRDGWAFVPQPAEMPATVDAVFEKSAPAGWVLRKTAHVQIGPAPRKGVLLGRAHPDPPLHQRPGRGPRLGVGRGRRRPGRLGFGRQAVGFRAVAARAHRDRRASRLQPHELRAGRGALLRSADDRLSGILLVTLLPWFRPGPPAGGEWGVNSCRS
jgi:hypothetical protein